MERNIVTPGNTEATLDFCVQQFIDIANESIEKNGRFFVALSGGSTPKIIYERLSSLENKDKIDWSKVFLFWGDERNVSPDDKESNYHMAMEAGFKNLPIPASQIFRMQAEEDIEANAKKYAEVIDKHVPQFDLILLGMGDDGHTASLFPHTKALDIDDQLVAANYIPQKKVWRMTLTYPCINSARHISIYILGESKKEILKEVLEGPFQPELYPIQKIEHGDWIMDD